MGQVSRLTPERHQQIIADITAGSYAYVAAQRASIHPGTYWSWMQRGREAERDEDGALVNLADAKFVEFYEAVLRAEAEAEARALQIIQQAALDGTWQAAAWYLERKHAGRWARRDPSRSEGETTPVAAVESHESLVADIEDYLADRRATADET